MYVTFDNVTIWINIYAIFVCLSLDVFDRMPGPVVSEEPDSNTVFLIKLQQKCLPNATGWK